MPSAGFGRWTMGKSSESFVCAECGAGMERVESVPVLQSLVGHAVHRCGECGHILLVPKKAGESLGWLSSFDCEIASAAFV